jgi:HD-GYP domain-containing protein (c-di-GMP phosphodiesterase class II)
VAVAVDQELLHQVERMIGELQELPFVAGVHLYSYTTGGSIWDSEVYLDEAFLARIQQELSEDTVLHLREEGARRGSLYSLWRSSGEGGAMLLEEDAVVVEIRMDFSFLVDVLYRGVGWGVLILLLGTAWMFWSVARTSLEIVRPFHVLMQGLEEFMAEPTSFALSEPLDEDTPLEVQELTRSFQNMGREIAAGMEELKAMNEELEELYMSREKLVGRLEHVISLAVSLGAARNMGQERYMNRILALAVDMLPGTSTGIVGVLEGEEVRILSGVGVDVKLLEDFPLKPEHVVFRGATVSFALMMDRWPEDLRKSFSRVCPEISQGLMVNLRAGGRVLGFLAVARSDEEDERFSSDTGRILDALGSLASGFLGMRQLFAVRSRFQEDLLRSIISILEMYDAYTSGHSENVARISRRVAQAMGLTPEQVEQTYWAGFVHDVGKLLVPTEVLNKIEPLTPEERDIIQTHPSKGREVLSHSSELHEIATVVEHHHERWDGRGYPSGLMGREIPLLSRILTVADAYDAMTSDRAYRKGISSQEARQELRRYAGTQFDPQVVEAFFALRDDELGSLGSLEETEAKESWGNENLWEESS